MEASDTLPRPGVAQVLAPGLRRVLAPNPSPMTGPGTFTHILGEGRVAVIDPGPADSVHLAALRAALAPGERVEVILVTHPHLDHSPLARPLAEATGAPVAGFGPPTAGRSPLMQRLASEAGLGGGEGVDLTFAPDVTLTEGERLSGAWGEITVLHTPGHFAGHLCFGWAGELFCGDQVMGWAPSLVSPPDGDMGCYMASLARLAAEGWHRLHPTHGASINDPAARIAELVAHRRGREATILAALSTGESDLATLTDRVYVDTPATLLPAARRNLLAHLIDLAERNLVEAQPGPSPAAHFALR